MSNISEERIEETVALIRFKLRNFKKIKPSHWNFSCPICGDSEKNKSKARGYIYINQHDKNHWYNCKNCGYHKPYKYFLRDFDPIAYRELLLDVYKPTLKPAPSMAVDMGSVKFAEPTKTLDDIAVTLSSLNADHPARKYVEDRGIPTHRLDNLYYIDNIHNAEDLSPKYKDKIKGTEPRIGIPYRTVDGALVGLSLRSMEPKHPVKYLHLKILDNVPFIYNIENVDLTKRLYVLEGQFDSMFFNNAVAVSGSGFNKFDSMLDVVDLVFIHDNEPRHKDTLNLIKKSIKKGYSVTLLPHSIKSKDINDMISTREITLDNLENFIDKHTYYGVRATLEFEKWKRLNNEG